MLRRLRATEGGFGMVELVLAMTILNVGLLALVSALSSGAIALQSASRISTAAALAEQQTEHYRALRYTYIRLKASELANDDDATYTGDTAYDAATMVTDANPSWPACSSPAPNECDPSRTVAGPDNGRYRIDTYITIGPPPGVANARDVKIVTVVVRNADDPTQTFARVQTTFDQASGM